MKSPFLALILLFIAVASSPAHRLAILPSHGHEDLEPLLVAALSSAPDLQLVERSQIDSIIREKRLEEFSSDPSKLRQMGELLGADSLLFMEQHGSTMISRLVAVGPALVVDEQTDQTPIKDPQGWAKFTANHVQSALKDLPARPGSAILLSILGIRNPSGTQEARRQEFDCTALIENALSSLGGVYLLERARLQESDFEKQLSQSASTPYWTSTWLLDGSLSGPDNALVFGGRLQQANGQGVQTFRVEAGSPTQLAQAVAAEVARRLGAVQAEARPATEEAAMFQAEAEWASQWQDYARAERAAAASWALGNHSDSLALLRAANAVAQTDWDYRLPSDNQFSEEPSPGMLDKVTEAFSYIQHLPLSPETCTDPAGYVKTMFPICKKATQALNTYYYLERSRTGEEEQSLHQIRSEIRRHLPLFTSRAKQLAAEKTRAGDYFSSGEFPADIMLLYGQFAPLWFDDPKSSSQGFLEAYRYLWQLDEKIRDEILVAITVKREEHMPLTVAWRPEDRSQAIPAREALIATIAASGPSGKLDAAALSLSRFFHTFNYSLVAMVPLETMVTAFHGLQDAIWDAREEIIREAVPEERLGPLLAYGYEIAEFGSYSEALELEYMDFRKKLLMFLMERKWAGPLAVYNPLISSQRFSPEESNKLIGWLSEMAKAPRAPRYTSFFPERIRNATDGGQPAPTPVADTKTTKRLAPTAIYETAPESQDLQVVFCIAREGSFFVRLVRNKLVEIDPVTGRIKRYDLGSGKWYADFAAWDVAGDSIFFGTKEKLIRIDRNTGSSTSLPIPDFEYEPGILRVINGKIYASLYKGGIVCIDPATGQSELLASARRRPAQSSLDDRAEFKIQKIITTPRGPAFHLEGGVFVWDERSRSFQKLPHALTDLRTYNPDFLLKWLNSEAPIEASASHLETCFLLDPQRTGNLPRITTWPPPMKINGDESFRSELLSSTAVGDTVYILFRGGTDRTLHLKVMDKNRNVSIPLDVPFGQRTYLHDISALESGVLLTGRGSKDAVFFSRKDLDAFQP
ncbi:MAG: hypothetical protein J0I10_07290 [Verrucomicrobia bacterium]|nr:hypothetical protein [Verrucomicrobiota bacterium]